MEIIVGGIAYFVITSLTGLYIPCPFRLITGYKCPGCGITRMILYLVEGNIYGAFEANQFVFLLLPGILLYGCCRAGKYIKSGEEGFSFAETVVLGVVLLGALIFGIIRNY